MIRTVALSAVLAAATISLTGGAQAAGAAAMGADPMGQFYATPIQSGAPTDLPGERLIPGASQTAMVIDTVTGPILKPILTPAAMGGEPAAMEKPMMKRHHMMHKHHMMKKKMMSKPM